NEVVTLQVVDVMLDHADGQIVRALRAYRQRRAVLISEMTAAAVTRWSSARPRRRAGVIPNVCSQEQAGQQPTRRSAAYCPAAGLPLLRLSTQLLHNALAGRACARPALQRPRE